MERDILALMNKQSHKFSKGQRLIAQYISSNYDKAAFMTAGKLGETVGVSESTVKLHINALLRSLHVTNRTQAVITAQKIGLI